VGNRVHPFVAGDKSNMQSDKIYNFLDKLIKKIKVAGYKPTLIIIFMILNKRKKLSLCNHSEMLLLLHLGYLI
jgi:hypothetical protein